MNIEKEEHILRKRFLDLAKTADRRGICVFSDFLNLNEQNILSNIKSELPRIKYFTFGGYPEAERKILCFCGNETDSINNIEFPIQCIKVEPVNQKFSDQLSHRDFLGAIINLGIDRSIIGDIIIANNEGFIFCSSTISDFVVNQLVKVKHTVIKASTIQKDDFSYKPIYKEIVGTVSSVRLDSILAVAFHTSRSSLTGLIENGKVYVNSRVVDSNSYTLKEKDIVSVRGYGKFMFEGTSYITKKGRYSVKVFLYI